MLKSFIRNNSAIAFISLACAGTIILGIVLAVAAYFAVQMLTQNILPICIGIAIVIVLPILAKAYYARQTGHEYPSQQRGDREQ